MIAWRPEGKAPGWVKPRATTLWPYLYLGGHRYGVEGHEASC